MKKILLTLLFFVSVICSISFAQNQAVTVTIGGSLVGTTNLFGINGITFAPTQFTLYGIK